MTGPGNPDRLEKSQQTELTSVRPRCSAHCPHGRVILIPRPSDLTGTSPDKQQTATLLQRVSISNKTSPSAPLFCTFNIYFVSSWSAKVFKLLQSHFCPPLAHRNMLPPGLQMPGWSLRGAPGQCGAVWQPLPTFHLLLVAPDVS